MSELKILGVDPASSKGLAVWADSSTETVSALESKTWMEEKLDQSGNVLICWDSPLTFDPNSTLSYRPVEKVLSKFIKDQKGEGLIADKAVSVLPFSGCSHWVISCEVVGQPFARPSTKIIPHLRSVEDLKTGGAWIVECHPAVAMAIWWLESSRTPKAFPKYKKTRSACQTIAENLGFNELLELDKLNDDILDAYVAYKLGVDLVARKAMMVGNSQHGVFVLPNSAEEKWKLQTEFEKEIES